MQVCLPAPTKANTQGEGVNVKESGLFADASYLEDGDAHLKAHLPLSVEAEVLYKEGEGNRTKRSREGVENFSTCRRHSPFQYSK